MSGCIQVILLGTGNTEKKTYPKTGNLLFRDTDRKLAMTPGQT